MNKFKLIIAPSSNDEGAFENATSFDEAKQVIESNGVESTDELEFKTERERDIFLQGYHAAIGYNGNGLYWKKDEN